MKSILIKCGLFFLLLVIIVAAHFTWIYTLLEKPSANEDFGQTTPEQLTYLDNKIHEQRGKVLAVVTSIDTMGESGKKTGYELTELSRAYYVFQANGFDVDIASPKGGLPPVVIDDELNQFDHAFLNDTEAQKKLEHSLKLSEVSAHDYQGIYFVGGKGTMFDFPSDPDIQRIVKNLYESEKTIGAVCHGPAALVNVVLSNGRPLLENKQVTAFSNSEELLLIPDAKTIFPFLLEDRLKEQGGLFSQAENFLNNVEHDGNLLTGQNPWSVWDLAEGMVRQMGYEPIPRVATGEEHAVNIVQTYYEKGYKQAQVQLETQTTDQGAAFFTNTIVLYALVAAWQWDIASAYQLLWLVESIK